MAGTGAFSDLVPEDDEAATRALPLIEKLENTEGAARRSGVPVDQVRSPMGAVGRYQIMPSTGALYGFSEDQLVDPNINQQAARRVLADLASQTGGDPALMAVGYNAGPARIPVLQQQGAGALPRETQGYHARALKLIAEGQPVAQAQQDPFADLVPEGGTATPGPGGDPFADLVPADQAASMPMQLPGATIATPMVEYVKNLFAGDAPLPDPSKPQETTMQALAKSPGSIVDQIKSTLGGFIEDIGTPTFADMNAVPGGAAMADALADRRGATRPSEQLAEATKGISDKPGTLANVGKKYAAAARKHMAENAPNVPANSQAAYAFDIANAVGTMVPMLAASMVARNPAPAVAGFTGLTYGDKYSRSREAGRTPEQAKADAAFYSAAESLPEAIPVGILMRPGKRFLGKMLSGAAAEGIQEPVTQALQMGYDAGVLKEDMTWGQARDAIVRAGLIGAATGGLLGGAVHGVQKAGDRRAAKAQAKAQAAQGDLFQEPTGDGLGGPGPQAPAASAEPAGPAPRPEPGAGAVDITPDKTTGLRPIHDPVTWAQTGWRDAAGNELPLDANTKPVPTNGPQAAAPSADVPTNGPQPAETAAEPSKSVENGQDQTELTGAVDRAFKARMAAKNPGDARWTDTTTPSKTAELVREAITTGRFNDALHPSNPNARATFEEITGTKLPKGVKATQAMFTGAPFQTKVAESTAPAPKVVQPAQQQDQQVTGQVDENPAAPENSSTPAKVPQGTLTSRGNPQAEIEAHGARLADMFIQGREAGTPEAYETARKAANKAWLQTPGVMRPGAKLPRKGGMPPPADLTPYGDDVRDSFTAAMRAKNAEADLLVANHPKNGGKPTVPDAVANPPKASTEKAGPTTKTAEAETSYDFRESFPEPQDQELRNAGRPGFYDESGDGTPDPVVLRSFHEESENEIAGYIAQVTAAKEAVRSGIDPTTGKPPKPDRLEDFNKKWRDEAESGIRSFTDALGSYESYFGADAAEDFREHLIDTHDDDGVMGAPIRTFGQKSRLKKPERKAYVAPPQPAWETVPENDYDRLEDATEETARHYAAGYGIAVKGRKHKDIMADLKKLGARSKQGGAIIYTPRSRADVMRLWKGDERLSDKDVARIKAIIAKNPDLLKAADSSPDSRWSIGKSGLGSRGQMEWGTYGDSVQIVGGADHNYGGMGSTYTEGMAKRFLKEWFAEHEEKGGVTPAQAKKALKTGIDPATGKKPKGNKAVRDFRASMEAIVSRETDEKARMAPVEPGPALNQADANSRTRAAMTPAERRAAKARNEKMGEDVEEPTTDEQVQMEADRAEEEAETTPEQTRGDIALSEKVAQHLERGGKAWDQKALMRLADQAYGGTAGQGAYDPRRAYDAMELGFNRYIVSKPQLFSPNVSFTDAKDAIRKLDELEKQLPIQSRRTGDTDAFQQFSTPPHYAFAAAWVANMNADDVVLEPSAGNGGLAVFAKNADAKVIVNEIGEGRSANLESLPFDMTLSHDAEQIHNLLPDHIQPNVVLMNPPFSNAAQRGGVKDSNITARHIDQALATLAPGGRLVAITGGNFTEGNSRNRPHFKRWASENRIVASVEVAGDVFRRYGTSYPTRVIVIDKAAPNGVKTVTGTATTALQLAGMLEQVRNARPESVGSLEQDAARAGGKKGARAGSRSDDAVSDPARGEGRGRTGNEPASEKPAERPVGNAARRAARKGAGVAGAGGPDAGPSGGPEGSSDRSGAAGGKQDGSDRTGLPADDAAGDGLSYQTQKDTGGEDTELSGGVYSLYRPQRLKIAGAKAHPAELVQSAAMASVAPPVPTYKPQLPAKVISDGLLSEAQLEPVVYAGQAHAKMLGDGTTRRGFFIGDGTGVGKGREISGIILDNFKQGRTKAVWLTEKWPLFQDAIRDWTGVGGSEKALINGKKIQQSGVIPPGPGIFFTTYDTLKGKEKPGKGDEPKRLSRVDQLVNWLGADFDGVVAFDEAHNMANADARKGGRGKILPSEKALAGIELQKKLPNARVVYVSATGATEVSNLGYAERLGLWGPGTSFPTKETFISQIEDGGVAAMELVARDMKQMGSYLARGLSFNGVEYSRLEHTLTQDQRSMYNALADAWQMVLANIDKALEVTGGAKDGRTKSAAYSAFWGSHQRFFNQVITSMQMPTVLNQVATDIKEGRAPVLQLVNTNEAAQERALARVDEDHTLEDLDLTPRDQLMQMVEHSFPVAAMETFRDEQGNERSRPVMDKAGNIVQDKRAVAIRDKVLDDLVAIRVPDGPLEYLINRFGPDAIAEVTGRTRRVVERKGKRVVERRPGSANTAEADSFMSGKKAALVFSMAGGTGRSYHADRAAKNQKRRVHYLLQPGWSAAPAIQGFGRTHRSNQVSKPQYLLATTDVVGQKRFISSIARRLDQLGALTKGERRSGGQGFFSEKDNLESDYAEDAVTRLVKRIIGRDIAMQQAGLTPDVLTQQMGLRGLVDERTGGLNQSKIPDVTQFLNRLLSLRLEMQDTMFDAFDKLFEENIEAARAAGSLDAGVEQIKADHIRVLEEQVVHTDEDSGSETKYVALETKVKSKPRTWDSVKRAIEGDDAEAWLGRGANGRTYMFQNTREKTDDRGKVEQQYRRIGPVKELGLMERYKAANKYEKLEGAEAKAAWEKELERVPEFNVQTEHMITGALLPIWDRLPKGFARVMRAKTDAGESFLGRTIHPEQLHETMKNLGATGAVIKLTPDQVFQRVVKDGDTATLANGWTLSRRTVAGEARIKLGGPNSWGGEREALERAGAQYERIGYEGMFFVPDNAKGRSFLEMQLKQSPIVSMGDDAEAASYGLRPTDPPFFSALNRAVAAMKQEKAPAQQWLGALMNLPGVKQEEIAWSGVQEWLSGRTGTVTKADLVQHLRESEVLVTEVQKGGGAINTAEESREMEAMTNELRQFAEENDLPFESADEMQSRLFEKKHRDRGAERDAGLQDKIDWLQDYIVRWDAITDGDTRSDQDGTKWGDYTLPGGENYSELLLTLPTRDNVTREASQAPDGWGGTDGGTAGFVERGNRGRDYRSGHWEDTPNVLAHVRFDDRVAPTYTPEQIAAIGKKISDAMGGTKIENMGNGAPGAAVRKGAITALEAAQFSHAKGFRNVDTTGATHKVLHVAEIQSDWHQAGRKSGYATKPRYAVKSATGSTVLKQGGGESAVYDSKEEADAYANQHEGWYVKEVPGNGVPDAPFKTSWHELAMKRVMRYAAEHGYDALSWDTGRTVAQRFGMEKHVGKLEIEKAGTSGFSNLDDIERHHDADAGTLIAYSPAGRLVMNRYFRTRDELDDLVGQEVAGKLLAQAPVRKERSGTAVSIRTLENLDQHIGGEGHQGFYDGILPKFVNKYAKKWGVKVRDGAVPSELPSNIHRLEGERIKSTAPAHTIDITPAMRESVLLGQPLFARGGAGGFEADDTTTRHLVGPPEARAELTFTPKFDAQRQALGQALRKRLDQVGLKDVKLIIPEVIRDTADGREAGGFYFDKLLYVAMDDTQQTRFLNHEVIHGLRDMGLIDELDWQILAKEAPKWVSKYGLEKDQSYSALPRDRLLEEGVAHAFPDYVDGTLDTKGNALKRVMRKIRKFFEAVRNALHGLGFRTTDDVFASIDAGQVGRPTDAPRGGAAFAKKGEEKPNTNLMHRFDTILGQSTERLGRRINETADRIIPQTVQNMADAIQLAVTPMAAGSADARATAKDFANAMRQARLITGRQLDYLNKNFTPKQLTKMWEAADEQSVAMQEGLSTKGIGKDRLTPEERAAVDAYQAESNVLLRQAQEIGLFKGEGLPSYVPRMVVAIGADGKYGRMGRAGAETPHGLDAIGKNLKTTSANLKHRKYLTTEETEAAARGLSASALVVRDFRTLPLAMQRIQEAIAGRTLIDRIKALGQDAGDLTVSEGSEPTSAPGWFTLDHPAFKTYRPAFVTNKETGKLEAVKDQNGDTIFERVPIYVRKDFEGPLRAVLSQSSGGIYRAAMDLKGKTMSIIMYSPLMHNMVIWGKAFPTAPIKIVKPLWRDAQGKWHFSIELYGRGRAAKQDPAQMKQALEDGLDPIGHRYFNQDLSAIMEEPNLKPGRSWTAQLIGGIPGLFDKEAGDAVKRAIDKAGDVWHNKLLWDMVGDLQMGLYNHMRDHAIEQGHDAQTAGRYAAHFANRYGGALPIEAMSKIARQTANLVLFSRSFTLTNLGAFKDMVAGLPMDVQAQIMRDKGLDALEKIQGTARRKGTALLLMDIFLAHVGLFLAQYALAWIMGHAYHPPEENEPGREARFLIGYQKDGTALYGRLPTGKVGEELQDWTTEPLEVTKRKLSPYGRAVWGVVSNDKGFGRKIYDPYDESVMGMAKNLGRVGLYIGESVAPISPFQAAIDLQRGRGDPDTNMLKIFWPMMGISISKGAPGGPAIGQLYASKDLHEFRVGEAMPEIRDLISSGDQKAAAQKMGELGLSKSYQKFIIRTTLHPGGRMSKKQMKEFMGYASPEEQEQMRRYLNEPKGQPKKALEKQSGLSDALRGGTLERFAENQTWTRQDAIRAAEAAGMPGTAALLRDARDPLRPELREKLLGETAPG